MRRLPPWDRRIDAVVLSHPHEDHVAGLARLLDRYRVGRVFEPGMRGPGPGLRGLARRGSPAGRAERLGLAAGDRLARRRDRADGPVARSAAQVPPSRPTAGPGINNVSIVLLGGRSATPVPADRRRRGGRSTRAARRAASRGSTCSRSPTTAAGPRRPRRSSTPSGRGSRSRRPAPATPTGTRRADARAPAGGRRPGLPDRPGRDGRASRSGAAGHGPTGRSRAPATRAGPRPTAPPGGDPARRRDRAFRCAIPVAASPDASRAARRPTPARPGDRRRSHRRVPSTDDGPRRVEAASLLLSLDPPPGSCGTRAPSPRSPPSSRPGSRPPGSSVDRRSWRRPRSSTTSTRLLPAGRSGPRPPPRRRLRGLADPARPPGAGARGRRPSGDAPRRRRRRTERWVGVRDPRGADRGLRGQARRPAPRVDGRALRAWRRRYPARGVDGRPSGWDDADLAGGPGRADRLEADVCRAAGIGRPRSGGWAGPGPALRAGRAAAPEAAA